MQEEIKMHIEIPTFATMIWLLPFLVGTVNAQQKDLRTLRLSVFRVDAAMVAAKARGLFAAEGLDVNITVTANSTEQMRGISKGAFDIVSTAFDNVLAWPGREGAEIVAVAQTADKIVLPVFVRPEIREWNDLRGKKLAVDAVDTAFALVLRRILLAHGLDLQRGDYELVPVGATGQRLDSLKRGETFAAILNPPFDTQAVGVEMVRFADSSEVLPDYPDTIWAVNRAWAKSHRGELVAFLRAWLAGVRWAMEPVNREAAIKLISAELKLSTQAGAGVMARLSASGALNLAGLQSVLDLRTQFGFALPMGAVLTPYYDLDYYRAAAGR